MAGRWSYDIIIDEPLFNIVLSTVVEYMILISDYSLNMSHLYYKIVC